MKYRKRMSKRGNRRSFKKGLGVKRKNYQSGYVKRGGMRF